MVTFVHVRPEALAVAPPGESAVEGMLVCAPGPDRAPLLWCDGVLVGQPDGVAATVFDPDVGPVVRVRVEEDTVWIGYPRGGAAIPAVDLRGRVLPVGPGQFVDLDEVGRRGPWVPWE